MSPLRYGVPPWLPGRSAGAARPSLRGELTTDVAIVGGGLAGCMTAAVFAQAGVKTVLLEADRLGRQVTAGALDVSDWSGGARFADLRARHGLRAARDMWEASRRAAIEARAFVRRLRVPGTFEGVAIVDVALSAPEAARLQRERAALEEGGFEAAWLTGKRARDVTGLEALAALKRHEGAAVNPYLLAAGLARSAEKRKAVVFERTEVQTIRFRPKLVEVVTARGMVRAAAVVVATGLPRPGLRALHRHLRAQDTTVAVLPPLPAPLRRTMGPAASVFRDGSQPPHLWRVDRQGALIVWQAAQAPIPANRREAATVQRTGQLMYELSLRHPEISGLQPSHAWTTGSHRSVDGLVIAGPHRAFPRHLFAAGLGAGGVQAAYHAARLNLRHHQGAPDKSDALFGFIR
jgi:glycine/D-amino acid oxidase-like deaminating enzyme